MKTPALLVVLLLSALPVWAEVVPNPLFSDHAVLQQGRPIPVWGTARAGEKVTVEFAGQRVATTAGADGRWQVKLAPLKAGGPHELTIRGDNVVTIADVLVGEVWVASGQSNMERQLGLRPPQLPIENWEQEAAAATFDAIRQFRVEPGMENEPRSAVKGSWLVCSPATAKDFSAVGFFFARDLYRKLGVPVGLLFSSVGGTKAQAWMSRATLEASPALREVFAEQAKAEADYPAALAKYQTEEAALLAKWQAESDAATKEGKPAPRKPGPPRDPRTGTSRPTVLYNAMIAPLIPYGIRGVIWYQGESDCGNPARYRLLFPALITSWRQAWGEGDFPFLFVQLAPYRSNNPELREAQFLTGRTVPGTAMVVTTDVGDANDIHPTRKGPVGVRLALAARALAYGEKALAYSGPAFTSVRVEGDHVTVAFDHAAGLAAKDGPLTGFELAGADGKFVPAEAKIVGETVVVTAPAVPAPAAVRYAWANVPTGNLVNAAGLPASPFRSNSP